MANVVLFLPLNMGSLAGILDSWLSLGTVLAVMGI